MTEPAEPPTRWSFFGRRRQPAKPLWALLAVSLLVAFETFVQRHPPYPFYMSAAIIAVTVWVVFRAINERSIFGFLAIPLALPWAGQILGAAWLDESMVVFFLSHSLFAVFIAITSYTFMAQEPRS